MLSLKQYYIDLAMPKSGAPDIHLKCENTVIEVIKYAWRTHLLKKDSVVSASSETQGQLVGAKRSKPGTNHSGESFL